MLKPIHMRLMAAARRPAATLTLMAFIASLRAVSAVDVAFVPKFDGLVVFDQALSGAIAAHKELGAPGLIEYVAPPEAENSGAAQIDIVQTAAMTGFETILLSNNAGNDIVPAVLAARDEGVNVITWDSPIPSGVPGGESIFISQVDFSETGRVMADMALEILSDEGGQMAILSASKKAANQNAWIEAMLKAMDADPVFGNLELVSIVYGNDDNTTSYNQAVALMNDFPNLDLIMSPTTIGISAAARAVQDAGKCDDTKVSGLGLPSEMIDYTELGCAPLFALWDFVDLGYLSYHAAYGLETGVYEVKEGATFQAGRLGEFTVEKDPTRDDAYRVILGGFTLFDKSNIETAVYYEAIQGDGGQESFEERFMKKYKKKAIAVIPKVTGMISFFASGYIVWYVLSDNKRRGTTKNRLLVGMSIHDMIVCLFGYFLSTWPIPKDTWLVWGASGTTQTCTMQGFFFQAGIGAAPLYSASLSTLYVLNVVLEMGKDKIVRRAEPALHGVPILFAWGTAIAGLPLKLYNSADRAAFMCWIAEYPAFCGLRDNCERGQNANTYQWAFLFSWVFAVFVYMVVCMALIYRKVLLVEKATDRWTQASGQQRRRGQSRKVGCQGLQYVVAFMFPWVFGITLLVMKNRTYFGDLSTHARVADTMIALEVTNAVIWPLKGFLTFLAYFRPRILVPWKREDTSERTSVAAEGGEGRRKRGHGHIKFSIKSFMTKSKMRPPEINGPGRPANGGTPLQKEDLDVMVEEEAPEPAASAS